MKKLLIYAALIAASANAHADWKRIDASFADVTLYIDHDSVSKISDRRLQIYTLLDYKSLQQRNDREFRSELSRNEYDCNKGEYHAMVHTFHKGQMGGDKMVHYSEGSWYWIKPEAGSVEEAMVRAICSVY
jgi:hypothetical protein